MAKKVGTFTTRPEAEVELAKVNAAGDSGWIHETAAGEFIVFSDESGPPGPVK